MASVLAELMSSAEVQQFAAFAALMAIGACLLALRRP